MKGTKLSLFIVGGIVIVLLAVGATLAVQRSIRHCRMKERMPQLAGLLGKDSSKDMLETIKMARVVKELDLNEEQIGVVYSRWNELSKKKNEYRKEKKEQVKKIAELLKAKASSEELQQAITILERTKDTYKIETEDLKHQVNGVLTVEQQAELIVFENSFKAKMRDMVGRKHRKGRFSGKGNKGQQGKQHQQRRGQRGNAGRRGGNKGHGAYGDEGRGRKMQHSDTGEICPHSSDGPGDV